VYDGKDDGSMSTGLECMFLEKTEGEWYYILEQYGSPKGVWDWLDYADAYGPFSSEEMAQDHLHKNHANPGGWSIMRADHYSALSDSQKEKYEDLTKHATDRGTNVIWW